MTEGVIQSPTAPPTGKQQWADWGQTQLPVVGEEMSIGTETIQSQETHKDKHELEHVANQRRESRTFFVDTAVKIILTFLS